MGGINHQPCRHYLAESTKLSLDLSQARSAFEQANVCLEQILLAELSGTRGVGTQMVEHLVRSRHFLGEAKLDIGALRRKLDENHFVDLPSISRIDFEMLGYQFVAAGMVSTDAWRVISGLAISGGFRMTLEHIERQLGVLTNHLDQLDSQVRHLDENIRAGGVSAILEENLPGNIRVAFAKTYCQWSVFMQEFLASALCSTEQWYVFMGYGSLLERPCLKEDLKRSSVDA